MKKTKFSYLEWNSKVFFESAKKMNFVSLLLVILDSAFYAACAFIAFFWYRRITSKMATFSLPQDITNIGSDKLSQINSQVQHFYYFIIGSFIFLVLAIIFLASIFKGIIWAKTAGKKITLKYLSRFLSLNLIWMTSFFAAVFLISWLVDPRASPIFMIFLLIALIYFTSILYSLFIETQKISSILESFKLGILKFHLLGAPFALVFLLAILLIKLSIFTKYTYQDFAIGFLIISLAAFLRYYSMTLTTEIKKLN